MTDHISPLISVSQLYDLLKNAPEKLRLFDVTVNLPSPRFDGDYRLSDDAKGWQSKHIPQARYCNILDEKIADHSAPYSFAPTDNQTLIKGLEEIGVDSNASIVLYDRGSGFWAARLWWVLKSIGVEAKVLDGGFSAWVQAGYPIESGNIENFSKGHIIY
ncbi:MAG: rhodanese-like domain-containing protein, partial [Zymomonas mobilis]